MWSLNWSSLSLLKFVTLFQRVKKKAESVATAPAATLTAYIIDAKAQKELNKIWKQFLRSKWQFEVLKMFSALMEIGISAEGITRGGESHLTNKGPGLLNFGGSTGGVAGGGKQLSAFYG